MCEFWFLEMGTVIKKTAPNQLLDYARNFKIYLVGFSSLLTQTLAREHETHKQTEY